MVCYAVPAIAAIIHYVMKKNVTTWKKNVHHLWLSLLLFGGAIFGIVDHLWNGELLLIGKEPLLDILLGATITIVMFIAWAVLVMLDKTKARNPSKNVN